ncbi:MAG: hypothetical protein QJR13_06645, partial [Bacillota bacterium]|nr:hypothetical protein [Bacillota bacterium]
MQQKTQPPKQYSRDHLLLPPSPGGVRQGRGTARHRLPRRGEKRRLPLAAGVGMALLLLGLSLALAPLAGGGRAQAAASGAAAGEEVLAPGAAGGREGPPELEAAEVEEFWSEGILAARGELRLRWPGGELQADELRAYTKEGVGEAKNLRGRVGDLFLTGEAGRFDLEGRWYVLDGASFTECDLPRPDYRFLAQHLTLEPGEWVSARGLWLELFGQRVLPLLDLRLPLRESLLKKRAWERLPMPYAGYNEDKGLYAGLNEQYMPGPKDLVLGQVETTSRRGPQVALSYLHEVAPGSLGGAEVRYDGNPVSPDLDGGVWIEGEGPAGRWKLEAAERDDPEVEEPARRDLRYLPRALWEGAERQAVLAGRHPPLRLTPSGEVGRLEEAQTGAKAWYAGSRLKWAVGPFSTDSTLSLSLGGDLEARGYEGGLFQAAAGAYADLEERLSSRVAAGLRYEVEAVAGRSPFLVDRREGESALTGRLAWRPEGEAASGPQVELSVRYDLLAGRLAEVAGSANWAAA